MTALEALFVVWGVALLLSYCGPGGNPPYGWG